MSPRPRDCVVQYLYVHAPGDSLQYPSSRASVGADRLATRYLECALVQAASLRFNDADCDLSLVTNVANRDPLGARGARLLERLESFGVQIVLADYAHRPAGPVGLFHASRYVFDAIEAVVADSPPGRRLWLTDADCVWVRPERVFAAAPADGAIGCIHMGYGLEWDASGKTSRGYDALRSSAGGYADGDEDAGEREGGGEREAGGERDAGGEREGGGERGAGGKREAAPRWLGGELLAGEASGLLELVRACEQLDGELGERDCVLGTEEQLLTLAEALGRARFRDLGDVAARIWTGPRHSGWNPPDPSALGFWHLPSEKGLGFRRAASALASGRSRSLARDLRSPRRAMRRFNVLGGEWTIRRLRDDSWILFNRVRESVLAHGR
jgi:hypothetical protein